MPRELKISVGQHSDKGRKETNQDFHGVLIPDEPLLSLKGIAIVLADGISSSSVSRVASEVGGQGISDRLLLHLGILVGADLGAARAGGDQFLAAFADRRSQYAYDKDRGYVCTLSAMVIKSTTAHLFHVGDSRIYRLSGNTLEQLTNDHRVVISSQQSYLGRALGVNPQIEIDYQMLQARAGRRLRAGDRRRLRACRRPPHGEGDQRRRRRSRRGREGDRRTGLRAGSEDNLTVQIVRVDELPDGDGQRSVRRSRTNCRCRRCWRRGRCSTATGSSANCTAPAAATSISPSTSRPTPWSPSRFRRSICATIPPT